MSKMASASLLLPTRKRLLPNWLLQIFFSLNVTFTFLGLKVLPPLWVNYLITDWIHGRAFSYPSQVWYRASGLPQFFFVFLPNDHDWQHSGPFAISAAPDRPWHHQWNPVTFLSQSILCLDDPWNTLCRHCAFTSWFTSVAFNFISVIGKSTTLEYYFYHGVMTLAR